MRALDPQRYEKLAAGKTGARATAGAGRVLETSPAGGG